MTEFQLNQITVIDNHIYLNLSRERIYHLNAQMMYNEQNYSLITRTSKQYAYVGKTIKARQEIRVTLTVKSTLSNSNHWFINRTSEFYNIHD